MTAVAVARPAPEPASSRRVGLAFAVVGAVAFSFKAVLVKLAFPYGVDAVTLLALRMGFSLPCFVAMGLVDARRRPAPLARADLLELIALGFFGYYLASLLDFLGLQYVTVSLERVILFAYPALVVLLSAAFLRKPVTRRALGALALCTAGVALSVAHDLRVSGSTADVVTGSALVFGAAVSYAVYLMGNGEVVGRLGSLRVTSIATSVAALACLAQFAATRPLSALALPWQVYALSGAMALFSTVLPVWWTSEAIRRLGAGSVSMIGTLAPVITIALGWAVLGEPVGPTQLAGAALVVIGVAVVARG